MKVLLENNEGLSREELAEKSQYSSIYISKLTSQLKAMGLVQKVAHPDLSTQERGRQKLLYFIPGDIAEGVLEELSKLNRL